MNWIQIVDFLDRIDKTIYENILIYSDPPWLRNICEFLVHKNNMAPLLVVFFAVYIYRNPKKGVILLVSTLILLGLSEMSVSMVKELVGRHRPIYQMGIYISDGAYSFPSAHAVNSMAFALFWSRQFPKASPYLFSFSIIIGMARMLANYHFPGDILGGWALGFLVGSLFVLVYNKIEKATGKNDT